MIIHNEYSHPKRKVKGNTPESTINAKLLRPEGGEVVVQMGRHGMCRRLRRQTRSSGRISHSRPRSSSWAACLHGEPSSRLSFSSSPSFCSSSRSSTWCASNVRTFQPVSVLHGIRFAAAVGEPFERVWVSFTLYLIEPLGLPPSLPFRL